MYLYSIDTCIHITVLLVQYIDVCKEVFEEGRIPHPAMSKSEGNQWEDKGFSGFMEVLRKKYRAREGASGKAWMNGVPCQVTMRLIH
jgi:hypothetical protein